MVIKDVYCLECEEVQRDVLVDSCDWTTGVFDCDSCCKRTQHRVLCNGGTRLKTYICSYDGRDWSGDIQHLGIEATYEDGTPVHENAGKGPRTDQKYRTDFESRVGEKRDRKRHALNKKRGKAPLHFT